MQQVQNESSVVALLGHPTARANALQAQYQAAEKKIDDAIRGATDLVNELMEFQAEIELSATIGERAISPALEALESLRKVRAAVVASHKQAELIGKAVGIRPSMTGYTKPQFAGLEQERSVG